MACDVRVRGSRVFKPQEDSGGWNKVVSGLKGASPLLIRAKSRVGEKSI